MVTNLTSTQSDGPFMARRPGVIELVGPAGGGKTTLSTELSQYSDRILLIKPPSVRNPVNAPFFLRNLLLITPYLFSIRLNNGNRWLNRREIIWIAILNGWGDKLRQLVANKGKFILLDQGPVFLLTQLLQLEPDNLKNRSFQKWWNNLYNQWSTILDMVIILDTSNSLLLERIRNRGKWHFMKGKPDQEVYDFLTKSRENYEYVISKLVVNGHTPKILQFDTEQETLDVLVNKLYFELALI